MQRDIDRLAADRVDLLIVGGGIYGCALAREAARRGLSVALIDKDDFCAATSANSLKIIHGGIRYLQQLDVIRLRQSVRERRTFLRIAPHLVHPLRCAMPTYGGGMKSSPALFCGLLLNTLLSWDRNRGLPADHRIGAGRVGSRAEWRALVPDIPDPRFAGMALWEDAMCSNTERLGLALVKAAVQAGARVANHLELTGFIRDGRAVAGVVARDRLTGRSVALRATCTVLNTGPWTRHTLALLGEPVSCPPFRLAKTLNVVLRRRLPLPCALGLPTYRADWDHSRLYFFVNWRGRTMIGTHITPHAGSPDDFRVTAEDLDAFLSILNQAHPGARLTAADVALVHAGLLPAADRDVAPGQEPALLNHFHIVDHARADGVPGLVTVLGVKYTTARDVADRTLAAVGARLGRRLPPAPADANPLPGGAFPSFPALVAEIEAAGVPAATARHLAYNHGTESLDVIALGAANRALLEPLGDGTPVLGAEVVRAAHAEMAATLADAVLRRTDLGTAGLPGEPVLRRAAALMAAELGWDAARVEQELADLREFAARFLPGVPAT